MSIRKSFLNTFFFQWIFAFILVLSLNLPVIAQESKISEKEGIPGIYVQHGGGLYSTNYILKSNGKYKEISARLEHKSRIKSRGVWKCESNRIMLKRKILIFFNGKETILYIIPDGRLKYETGTNGDLYFKK